MVLGVTFFTNLLLATTSLALLPRPDVSTLHRDSGRIVRVLPIKVNMTGPTASAGASLSGNWTSVSANIVVPVLNISVEDPGTYYTTAYVGVLANERKSELKTGISFSVTNGTTTYGVWCQRTPGPPLLFNRTRIEAGDKITLAVIEGNATGVAIVENHTKNHTMSHIFNSTEKLFDKEAEWGMEFWGDYSPHRIIATLGSFTFSNAMASNRSRKAGPSGAAFDDNNINGTSWAEVVVNSTAVTVEYVGVRK